MLTILDLPKHTSHGCSEICAIQISLNCFNLKALYNDRYYNHIHQGFFFIYFSPFTEHFIDLFSYLEIMLSVFEQPDLDHSKTRAESTMGFFFSLCDLRVSVKITLGIGKIGRELCFSWYCRDNLFLGGSFRLLDQLPCIQEIWKRLCIH